MVTDQSKGRIGVVMYKAKEPKFLWLLLLLISLAYTFYFDNIYRLVTIALSAVFAVLMFSYYELAIDEKRISFSWYVAGIKVIHREISAASVKKIMFIESSRQTIALVELHKGLRLKLHRFKPVTYIEELRQFAQTHQIDTEETSFLKQRK